MDPNGLWLRNRAYLPAAGQALLQSGAVVAERQNCSQDVVASVSAMQKGCEFGSRTLFVL